MKKNIQLKFFSVFMALIILCGNFPIAANANNNDFYAQYSGSTTASWGYKPDCIFTINKIVGNKFRGNFSAQNIGQYSFVQDIAGTVARGQESFTCFFRVNFYNNRYYSNIIATVYPYDGKCECFCEGSWHLLDFEMTGTKFSINIDSNKIINSSNYNENDMILCMKLSNYIYGYKEIKTKKDGSQEKENVVVSYDKSFKDIIDHKDKNFFNTSKISKDSLKVYNFKHLGVNDHNADNVAFAIMLRETDNGSADVFVVIRGTYNNEWQGNTEITGTEYNETCKKHENFQKASDSIKSTIKKYVKQNCLNYDNVNLIITGHSRGAAVANLYAKEATDSINGVYNNSIPSFSSITAYTFATPNVAIYDDSMENYNNIYNFCFEEDIVPTVPLTKPIDGWGYWKYGKTFTANLKNIKTDSSILTDEFYIVNNVPKIHNCLWKWLSVEDYYNKRLYAENSTKSYTTLYDFAHSAAGLRGSFDKKVSEMFTLIKNYKKYKDIYPIIGTALPIVTSIDNAHHYDTYFSVISKTGDDKFKLTTFDEIASSVYSNNTNQKINIEQIQNTNINNDYVTKLVLFANQDDNLSILNWDLDDPLTWTGITWNEDGNVEGIDLSFKNLSGSLDLSNFGSLKKLDVTGNNLTSLNLDNCSSLEEIDCSFNKLTALDLSDCTNLTSVTCCYNYLDTHEGSTLYNTLDDLMFSDCYVNYYPQSVPNNATFDSAELNALKTFANTNNNNTVLNWLNDNGNIDTEKLQNNVSFEYDGSKYRVVAIDISDLDISGVLDLTSLSLLQELYCENTKITTLNIKGCVKLKTLKCDGCELASITLPSNANAKTSSLYDVSCEYNYLDTSIFTQDVIKYVEFKAGGEIQYENQKGDSSALQAAVSYGESLEEVDYSKSSFAQLNEILCECKSYDYDNLYLTQADIDNLTADILTKIYNLKAFLNAKISSENGIVKVFYDETELEDSNLTNSGGVIELPPDTEGFTVSDGSDTFSVLFGTTVTLTATPKEGYSFVGWYNSSSNRYISTENLYTFKATANADIKAVFASDGDASLTFLTPSNQVVTTVSKFAAEWAEVGTINDLLPDVPFKYGYKNGRWEYNEADVLSKLRSGENVSIVSAYDKGEFTVPSPRNAENKPALDLYYNYDDESGIGSFIMTTGFPENIKVESVGIAYYFKAADSFNPKNYILTLNNKVRTSKFGTDNLYDYYIMNMKNINDKNNWSVRGYVAYYDSDNNLQVEYSNQINIVNNIADRCAVRNDSSATQLPPDGI